MLFNKYSFDAQLYGFPHITLLSRSISLYFIYHHSYFIHSSLDGNWVGAQIKMPLIYHSTPKQPYEYDNEARVDDCDVKVYINITYSTSTLKRGKVVYRFEDCHQERHSTQKQDNVLFNIKEPNTLRLIFISLAKKLLVVMFMYFMFHLNMRLRTYSPNVFSLFYTQILEKSQRSLTFHFYQECIRIIPQ